MGEMRCAYNLVWHLRTRVGRGVGLVQSIHDGVCDATAMPRVLMFLVVRLADAIA